jgi:hypothetical protein
MKNSDEQTRKKIRMYKTLLGFPVNSKLSPVQQEIEDIKRLYELLSRVAGDDLPNVLMDLMTNEQTHSPDEN